MHTRRAAPPGAAADDGVAVAVAVAAAPDGAAIGRADPASAGPKRNRPPARARRSAHPPRADARGAP